MTRITRPIALAACAAMLTALAALAAPGTSGGGAEKPGVVRCANLIYANNKTSVCFSDEFLTEIEKESNVRTTRKFAPMKLESQELYEYPFAVMTGEGAFSLSGAQRDNLRNYLTRGGFLVASPGCSNGQWATSFTSEIKAIFPDLALKKLAPDHPIFHTVYDIKRLTGKRSSSKPYLMGLEIEGKIVLVYTPDGLNDTANAAPNCCCCGGNEIRNARQVNVNLLAYALTH